MELEPILSSYGISAVSMAEFGDNDEQNASVDAGRINVPSVASSTDVTQDASRKVQEKRPSGVKGWYRKLIKGR